MTPTPCRHGRTGSCTYCAETPENDGRLVEFRCPHCGDTLAATKGSQVICGNTDGHPTGKPAVMARKVDA